MESDQSRLSAGTSRQSRGYTALVKARSARSVDSRQDRTRLTSTRSAAAACSGYGRPRKAKRWRSTSASSCAEYPTSHDARADSGSPWLLMRVLQGVVNEAEGE